MQRYANRAWGHRLANSQRGCFVKTFNAILLLVMLCFATPAWADDVGSVRKVEGESWIIRGDQQIAAEPGIRLFVADIMRTGKDGAMGVILRDDTIIAMGPDSEMILTEFVFQPEKERFAMLTQMLKGTFSYLSGVMSTLSPSSVRVETPVAMVAVSGTSFLVKVE